MMSDIRIAIAKHLTLDILTYISRWIIVKTGSLLKVDRDYALLKAYYSPMISDDLIMKLTWPSDYCGSEEVSK